ncbi:MAG: RNA polymerase sigma factor [Candidatus Promineifilaceae bacterium]|jgi:RNA polymerase sigma factor (sigma-70 family)
MTAPMLITDYKQLSDADLISACKDGEEAAWNALVTRYERLVYTIPHRYGLTPTEVSDVFQTVWLSLLKNLKTLRQPDRLAAWLVTTTRRECWERRRGKDFKKIITSELDSHIIKTRSEEPSPDELVSTYERHEALRKALEHLDPRCRQMIELLYFDPGIPSYADIAENLGMPIGSIGPLRARCLKKLRKILVDFT